MRRAHKRRDANESAIRDALAAAEFQSWQISGWGMPDLLVFRAGRFYAMEIKTAKGKRTKAQTDVPWPIVRSIEEAFTVVGGFWPH